MTGLPLLLLLFGSFLVLMALGVPVAFAMGISAIVTLLIGFPGIPITIIPIKLIDSLSSWLWLAIPLYMVMGNLMNATGITTRLVDLAQSLVGRIAGGLSHVSVLANVLMAGISGSSVADCAAIGSILIPAMKKSGYAAGYAAGVVGTGAIIGMLIPPSINLLIVGEVGDISILRLWLGGVVPGLVVGVTLLGIGYIISRRRNYPRAERSSVKQIARRFAVAIWALVVPFVVLLGMRAGIFTPTEAGAVGTAYVILVGAVIYKGLTWRGLIDASLASAKTTAAVLFIIAFGSLMGWLLAVLQVGPTLQAIITSITTSKIVFLFVVAIVLVFLGCFVDVIVIILILLPLFVPMARVYGVDPVHFGVFFSYCCMVGMYTPPVGVVLYLSSAIAEIDIAELLRDGGVFVLGLFAVVPILILFPQVILWLPNLVLG